MLELVEANWLAFLAVLLLGLAVAWWIWGRGPGERLRAETPDVLTPGAAPAQRNQALVDAPSAAAVVTTAPIAGTVPATMAGIAEVVAAAAAQEITAIAPLPPSRPAIAPAQGEPDDLTRIKGVGPKLSALLRKLGVTRYDQIAAWSEADIAAIDPFLGTFHGRIGRDNWVEQCRYLAVGDVAGFEAKFGKV